MELENFDAPPGKFALSAVGANAAPSANHRIELREFDLQLELAGAIAHLHHQTHERLLSCFQRRHKKKQGTMPSHPATTTAHFFGRKKPPGPLAKPKSPAENSEKPGPSVHATQRFHKNCAAPARALLLSSLSVLPRS